MAEKVDKSNTYFDVKKLEEQRSWKMLEQIKNILRLENSEQKNWNNDYLYFF